jgi:hypothetical protein
MGKDAAAGSGSGRDHPGRLDGNVSQVRRLTACLAAAQLAA